VSGSVNASIVRVDTGIFTSQAHSLLERQGVFALSDENVAAVLPATVADRLDHILPPGETAKTWEQLGRLLEAMDAAGLDRDGHVLAIGGGVVTDIGGLAASLHRRGIAWTAMPTSLVGQVDAALGGKTAVNLGGGKNTVGTFHPPAAIVVDPTLLATLPDRHLRAGMAEVLKTALVSGTDLTEAVIDLPLSAMARAEPAAVDIITRCLATKDELVTADLTDQGPRRLLNLGHTFGHAFEALALPDLVHGEAVGLGLLCAARLGAEQPDAEPGLEGRLREALSRWGLPTTWEHDPQAVLDEMRRDKKRRAGTLRLVVPLAPGRVEIQSDPGRQRLAAALAAVGHSVSTS
jgi:3-dehydroquinate synthase